VNPNRTAHDIETNPIQQVEHDNLSSTAKVGLEIGEKPEATTRVGALASWRRIISAPRPLSQSDFEMVYDLIVIE
jgi:hypothetical protein